MKFIHAADLHIDSPMRGLDNYDGAPVDLLRGASRKALIGLVDLALREKVDLVLLAGKGHEPTILYADHALPWDEAAVARELLAAMGFAGG